MSDAAPTAKSNPEGNAGAVSVPELTLKAIVLGALFAVVMGTANVYLGLKVGMTVSASIPSAVLSMLVLRAFKNRSILENNVVQTAASAGESLAAGCIFTLPALLLLGEWEHIRYADTVAFLLLGGLLGVIFSIPLRKLFVVREGLTFPEGVATSKILLSGEKKAAGVGWLLFGGMAAALMKFFEASVGLWKDIVQTVIVIPFGSGWLSYFGAYLSPALVGVGYIIGPSIAFTVFAGGFVSWLIILPWVSESSASADNLVDFAFATWSSQIRYVGVGTMVVGGLWTLLTLRRALVSSLRESVKALTATKAASQVPRTERDLPMPLLWALLLGIVVMVGCGVMLAGAEPLTAFVVVLILIGATFLFSAVSGYMAGLVGSSNNPVSGVMIATVLLTALVLTALAQEGSNYSVAYLTVVVGVFVCCAAAIAGDNLQDLKAGYLLGATPYRQQCMQIVGVVAAALSIPWVLSLLHETYEVGSRELSAPQATLVASIIDGVQKQSLPWVMIGVGVLLGVLAIVLDRALQRKNRNWRFPVLAFAVGIYLPFALGATIALGGLLAFFAQRAARSERDGILLASGLITGEALMGVFVALLVSTGVDMSLGVEIPWLGGLLFAGVLASFSLLSSARKVASLEGSLAP